MKRLVFALVVASIALLAAGCTQRLTDFTIISTKNTALASLAEKAPARIEGSDCVPWIIWQWGNPNLKEAIDDAIEQAGQGYDALSDGVVSYTTKGFIFGAICYEVEGTPIRKAGTGPVAAH